MEKKGQLSITLDEELINKIKEEADNEGRTVSGYLNQLIKKTLK